MINPQKRSRLWTFLSLWSLLALAAPQLLWACPIMNKVASTPHAACCCAKKASAQSTSASKETVQHAPGCCKKVPLPSGDTSGQDGKIAPQASRNLAASFECFPIPSTPAVTVSLEIFEPQTTSVFFLPATFPRLISQHAFSPHSGRAPPF